MAGNVRSEKRRWIYYFLVVSIILSSCSRKQEGERLARQYCGTCHLFPSPALLDKNTWMHSVIPEMEFRMGYYKFSGRTRINYEDLETVLRSIPARPMISEKDLELIKEYYQANAPDSLSIDWKNITDTASNFVPLKVDAIRSPMLTLLKFDTLSHTLYAGTRPSVLYRFTKELTIADSVQLSSPPSDLKRAGDRMLLSLMGIMDPNDQKKGKLVRVSNDFGLHSVLIDSLRRPVFFEQDDLNQDGFDDFVVCNFGNYTGNLVIYSGKPGEQPYILYPSAGSRKIVIRDFNKDGFPDVMALMTQGDEKLSIFYNYGNWKFSERILARFPPVYGSNYFELADFNGDGFPDIVMTNGDNADYSILVKPYHALRIFLNDKTNSFNEAWTFAMPGASQAVARDFDLDGDPDIAAISFFPDDKTRPEQRFIYFENTGGLNFKPHIVPQAVRGQWLVMEAGDYDGDKDADIFLGAFDLQYNRSPEILRDNSKWKESPSMLVLQNNVR